MITLLDLSYRRRFAASDGGNGQGGLRHGKRAADIDLEVPVGTSGWIVNGKERLVADLGSPGVRVEVARGGQGGRGNARFASSTNQFPLLAEQGEDGERLKVRLELSLVGDVGIIGAPNVGKSSLLAAATSAHPRIASYPFSTLEPSLGVVEHGRARFVLVDIPGLIEGAHKGTGLGHTFLRHVDRTRVLVHVVDGADNDAADLYQQVRSELGLFDESLLKKREIVAINKMDMPEARANEGRLLDKLAGEGREIYSISAAARQGLDLLLDGIAAALDAERARTLDGASQETLPPRLKPRPVDKQAIVRKTRTKYIVTSQPASRLAGMVDGSNWTARLQLYEQLRRLGVISALEKAGIKPGEKFKVGRLEWEWLE